MYYGLKSEPELSDVLVFGLNYYLMWVPKISMSSRR